MAIVKFYAPRRYAALTHKCKLVESAPGSPFLYCSCGKTGYRHG